MIANTTFDELVVGQTATHTHTVSEEDIILFAKVSGDTNPIHLDEEYAKTTEFGGRIAHGMLSGAIISAAMAQSLPGPGSIYLSQNMKFKAPVRIGDTLTVSIELTEKKNRRAMIALRVIVTNQDGVKVVVGDTTAIAPTEKLIVAPAELPSIKIG
mgnify:CR=1 FL=1